MSDLTPEEISTLRWMERVNGTGRGLFGPTVKRQGSLAECARLVEMGLAELRLTDGKIDDPARGYFITEAGREVSSAQRTA
jgi:hypothetical protein